MKVLLTGPFGNVGKSTLNALLAQGHQVQCFARPTPKNRRIANRLPANVKMAWGDVCNVEDVTAVVADQDIVIHTAAVIAPTSEQTPERAYQVNVEGTRNLINALNSATKLIYASSVTVHGSTQHLQPPRRATNPIQPADHYTRQKVQAEQIVRESALDWSIYRISVVVPFASPQGDGMRSLFLVPLNTRMELIHSKDVGLAFANGVTSNDIWGKTLLIGGGKDWQVTYGEITMHILNSLGIGLPSDAAFNTKPYYTDWLDTSESQQLLNYQCHRYADYVQEMYDSAKYIRPLVRLFSPLIRQWLLTKSAYIGQGVSKQ